MFLLFKVLSDLNHIAALVLKKDVILENCRSKVNNEPQFEMVESLNAPLLQD